MTAAELIGALRAVAPETRIVAPGLAGGLTTIVSARLVAIVRDPAIDAWDGPYSEGGPNAPERAFLIGRAGV